MTKFTLIQLAGRGAMHLPTAPDLDWPAIFADPSVPLVFTDSRGRAADLVVRGVAAIAVSGVSRDVLERWLAERGADVIVRQGALH